MIGSPPFQESWGSLLPALFKPPTPFSFSTLLQFFHRIFKLNHNSHQHTRRVKEDILFASFLALSPLLGSLLSLPCVDPIPSVDPTAAHPPYLLFAFLHPTISSWSHFESPRLLLISESDLKTWLASPDLQTRSTPALNPPLSPNPNPNPNRKEWNSGWNSTPFIWMK